MDREVLRGRLTRQQHPSRGYYFIDTVKRFSYTPSIKRKSYYLLSRRRLVMNPEKIVEDLIKELNSALKAMSKAKTVEEKAVHSEIVKNLCKSLGVFLNLASNMMENGFDDLDEDE
jgi:hypothetical protein